MGAMGTQPWKGDSYISPHLLGKSQRRTCIRAFPKRNKAPLLTLEQWQNQMRWFLSARVRQTSDPPLPGVPASIRATNRLCTTSVTKAPSTGVGEDAPPGTAQPFSTCGCPKRVPPRGCAEPAPSGSAAPSAAAAAAGYSSVGCSFSKPTPYSGPYPGHRSQPSVGLFAPDPRLAVSLRKRKKNPKPLVGFQRFLLALTLSKLIGLRSGDQNSPSSAARVSKMALQVFSKRAALFCASPFFTQCR